VSMTASVESFFGSSRMAGGMFLNNQLTDFAKQPRDADGVLAANHAAPGKRPRSSMSPTLVLDQSGAFRMATGSPGGNSIIAYTLKTLVGVLDWKMSPQEAVNLPNIVARGDTVRIESSRASPALIAAMREHGFKVKESAGETSGLSVVLRHPDGKLQGGVDPRREGTIARIGIADPLEPLATRNP
jgi:gamma-glutamyltranspeptidase/glutathione hydrolase